MQPDPNNMEQFLNQGMNGQQIPPEAIGMAMGILIVILLFALAFYIVLKVLTCIFLSRPLKAVPEQYRLMSPGLVWLWVIPCFDVIWSFFVFPKVAKSLKQFANAQGNSSVGDCGETLGWVFCGLYVAQFVLNPVLKNVGGLFGLASLVLLIIYLVKVNSIASKLKMAPMQATTATVMPPEQPNNEGF